MRRTHRERLERGLLLLMKYDQVAGSQRYLRLVREDSSCTAGWYNIHSVLLRSYM